MLYHYIVYLSELLALLPHMLDTIQLPNVPKQQSNLLRGMQVC
jgi:hypothetical protein